MVQSANTYLYTCCFILVNSYLSIHHSFDLIKKHSATAECLGVGFFIGVGFIRVKAFVNLFQLFFLEILFKGAQKDFTWVNLENIRIMD